MVCHRYPEKAPALLSCKDRSTSGWWKIYDESVRHAFSLLETASFGANEFMYVEAVTTGSQRRSNAQSPAMPAPVGAKKKRRLACYAWNDGRPCVSLPCRFSHVCSRCGGDHARRSCHASEASAPGWSDGSCGPN